MHAQVEPPVWTSSSLHLVTKSSWQRTCLLFRTTSILNSCLSRIQLFQKTLFSLFILSGYQSPELNSCTSKRRPWEGRGACLSSSAPSLSAMATEGFLRPITGPLWLSLYTEKPYRPAQRCRAICWCKCHLPPPPHSSNRWRRWHRAHHQPSWAV